MAEGVAFIHPQATRDIQLGPARVGFELKRAQRRTIGLQVGAEGLSVRAPRWASLRDIDQVVREKGDWILRKLKETHERHEQMLARRIVWREGAELPFLGQALSLRLDPGHRFANGGAQFEPSTTGEPAILWLALAQDASSTQIRDAAQAWLMRQARRIFTERLDLYAPRLGVEWKKLSLSNAASRWGSANSQGAIRLHWHLVHMRMTIIDYVVVHELSHLRHMNHGPQFWDTVQSVLPGYEPLRQALKRESLPNW